MYQKILEYYCRISTQISEIQEKISSLPEGTLVCCSGKKSTKWYRSFGSYRNYIHKNDRITAEQLAVKKYLTMTLKQLSAEKLALEAYLKCRDSAKDSSSELLFEKPCYQELLSPYFKPSSQEIQDWMEAKYEKNPSHPENLVHNTRLGFHVRSKSESMIANFLYTNHIPFRYECSLSLGAHTLFPDFTILHPETHEIYYWEHFGMMDDPAYSKNACTKLQLYTANGIIPSIQLLTTYETQTHPLSYEEISFVASRCFPLKM